MRPTASIVIPAYNEGEAIRPLLEDIARTIKTDFESLVVYDDPSDTTAPVVRAISEQDPRVKPTLNTDGRGPAHALRYGIDHAAAPVAVVMMADGSDDPEQIDDSRTAPADLDFDEAVFASGWKEAGRLVPEIRDAGRTQCVYGMFSFTPDTNSLIGEVHGVTGLYLCEAVWVTHGPGAARAVVDLMTEGGCELISHAPKLR